MNLVNNNHGNQKTDKVEMENMQKFQPIALAKKPKKKKRWILRFVIFFILFLILSIVGKYIHIGIIADRKIAEELQRFKDDGISLNPEDYAPAPVPDDENAAIILAEAFKKLPENEQAFDELAKLLWDYPVKEDIDYEFTSNFVNENEECIEIVKKALKRIKCRFDVDYNSLEPDLPHTFKIINLVKIISCKAVLNMQEKNLDDSVENTALALKLSSVLIDEPNIISQAIYIVSYNYAMRLIKQLLVEFTLNDDQCQQLLDELEKHTRFSINKALIIEFINHLNNFKVASDGTADPQKLEIPWWYLRAFAKTDYGVMLELKHDLINNQKTPSGKSKIIQAKILDLKWDLYDYPRFALLSPAAMPIYKGFELDAAMTIAKIGMAKAALAIQIYYNRNKKLPETLDELVEQKIIDSVPQDPFRKDALTYLKIDEKTYKIYTYGENLKDDGGKPVNSEEDDYAWSITVK